VKDSPSSTAGRAAAAPDPGALPFFEEVPPAASGIHWAHVAGLSSKMYVPETIGPGGAFLDYDNDGWMDIYLVNSGPCDFYTPPQPLAVAGNRTEPARRFLDRKLSRAFASDLKLSKSMGMKKQIVLIHCSKGAVKIE